QSTSSSASAKALAGTAAAGLGVYASSQTGYAGQFDGKVRINGKVTINGDLDVYGHVAKSSGAFKIDHPLDPENEYLSHSFVESPDMKNVYDGVVTLNETGEAMVQLPDWFEALNRDFRYQLTCIGGFAPVYIAEDRFRIAGGSPGMKVSWQVTGIRHDPWAEAHRIPVEEEKPEIERGRYLHPELYRQPAKAGIGRPAEPGSSPNASPSSTKLTTNTTRREGGTR
ncbi:MAG: hypothetical protein GXP48_04065, partial [Acidobacteria bacterium]|nr:hypothetical protein [Acidobacteriota bacterium]